MHRRTLLASTASLAAAGAAGCIGTRRSPTVERGTTVTLDGINFELGRLRLQSTFVEQGKPFWNWDAKATADAEYAVVTLRPQNDDEGRAPEAARNATIEPAIAGATQDSDHYVNEEDYDGLRVAVPVPTGERPESAAVAFDGSARYPLSADHLDVLAEPPRHTVELQVPDTFDGTRIPVELAVTNDGGSAGTVAWTTSHSVLTDTWWTNQISVPGGETKTTEHVHDIPNGDEIETVDVRTDWGYDNQARTVTEESR